MRKLRWKSRYATGDPERDRAHREILERFNAFVDASHKVEHCQDMSDLLAELARRIDTALAKGEEVEDEVRRVLEASLPLDAKDTPACTHCGLCDIIEERLACTGETACSSP
ncbi:MAG: hypothetical protein D6819_01685 [Gammaproteobacteria bacterium]|nr:MAG: hypothetical protein D6819_01685 [Gammaproteobacteria bacterium]